MTWFEDVVVGETIALGDHLFTSEEIIRFARVFDPQPFHTDPEAARRSHFGGLCASGWHTVAIWMRLMADFARREADEARVQGRTTGRLGPSPGFERLRWPRPVYAGERVVYRTHVRAKRTMRSRPDWGLMQMENEGVGPAGELVLSFLGTVMVERRVGGAAGPRGS